MFESNIDSRGFNYCFKWAKYEFMSNLGNTVGFFGLSMLARHLLIVPTTPEYVPKMIEQFVGRCTVPFWWYKHNFYNL